MHPANDAGSAGSSIRNTSAASSASGGASRRPATAAPPARATTFTEGDGLRPGTYEVRIECAAAPARPLDAKTHDLPAKELVPAAFQPPDLVVPPSGPRPVRYDLDVR